MDFLSAKAMTIAVGIAVSLAITSSILFTLNKITLIYQDVYNTDVSLKKEFNEYSMYQRTTMTGLEMYNTAKKYKNNPNVIVKSGATIINTDTWINNFVGTDANYTSRLYSVTYDNTGSNQITIKFVGM